MPFQLSKYLSFGQLEGRIVSKIWEAVNSSLGRGQGQQPLKVYWYVLPQQALLRLEDIRRLLLDFQSFSFLQRLLRQLFRANYRVT